MSFSSPILEGVMSLTPPAPPSEPIPQQAFQQNPQRRTSLRRHAPSHIPRTTHDSRSSPPHRYQRMISDHRTPLPPLRGAQPSPSPPRRKHKHEQQLPSSDSNSDSSSHSTSPCARRSHYKNSQNHRAHHRVRDVYVPTIRPKTLEGLLPWPTELKLSFGARNWLEWSRCLLTSLAIYKLDEYPQGLLNCPDENVDPIGRHSWDGNDRMILGFMKTHMYLSEVQHIATCATSAEAFCMLRVRYEIHTGRTQLQLIWKLMTVSFDDNAELFDSKMKMFRHLVYQIESLGHVDVPRLGLLFLWLNLKTSHPTVHDALVPALIDGTISVELMEARMNYYFEIRAAQSHSRQFLSSSFIAQ